MSIRNSVTAGFPTIANYTSDGTITGITTGNVICNVFSAPGGITLDNLEVESFGVTVSANLGNVANIRLGGGNNGQVLATDGLGNLNFVDLPIAIGAGNAQSIGINQIFLGNTYIEAFYGQTIEVTTNQITVSSSTGGNITEVPVGNYRYLGGAINVGTGVDVRCGLFVRTS